MSAREMDQRRYRIALALIVVASGLFRLLYVLLVKRDDPLWTDEFFYTRQAIAIADGRGFENPILPGVKSAGHAPMTVVALAPVSWLDGAVTAQRMLMAVYGTAVVVAIGAVARMLFDRRTSLVAAMLAGGYAGLWLNDVMVMSETFAAGTVVAILWSAYRYRAAPSWTSAAVVGVTVAAGGYARTELLALGGTIAIFVMWLHRRPTGTVEAGHPDPPTDDDTDTDDGTNTDAIVGVAAAEVSRPIGFAHLALAGVVTLTLLAPWVARNLAAFEEPTYISTQDGGTLLGANCPAAYDGRFVGFWELSCVAAIPTLEGEDQSQTEARYRDAAFDYIGENVDELPRVTVFRVARGFGFYRPDDMTIINQLDGRNRWASWISTIQFWALGVLAIAGLRRWPSVGRWFRPRWPIVATMVFTLMMMAISYGNPRFRVPIEPGLVIAASVAVVGLVDRWRRRNDPAAPATVKADAGAT
ncbi:MAG: hypothetical protein ABJH68_18830 [Ilumatobacter sp.]|uniref:hypothetical protein n=1 Tax=Ilumatobacter sp. TaxID=1967498 RepID=UPI0032968223